MTYRQIAQIARCSTGAVGSEMRALKKEGQMIQEMPKRETRPIVVTKMNTDFEIVRF